MVADGAHADGAHTVSVRATDKAGNVGMSAVTFTVDRIAPIVMLTSAPPPVVERPDSSASFAFSVTDANDTTSTCLLDGTSMACSNRVQSYTNVAIGMHTFAGMDTGRICIGDDRGIGFVFWARASQDTCDFPATATPCGAKRRFTIAVR